MKFSEHTKGILKMRIKFVDLGKLHEPIINEINEATNKVINKSNFVLGEELSEFEESWARYTKQKYAVGVSSGYHALELSKIAVMPKLYEQHYNEYYDSGFSVIIPTNSFIATANAFSNMFIQFSDIDPLNHLIDTEKLENTLISDIIVPVNLYGQPCNMNKIEKLPDKHNSIIITDSCQGHGTDPKLIGRGIMTCYSFYPSKNLGCFGDGGIITTNNSEIADRLRLLRSYGENPKNNHKIIGYNCRLDTIQAAILNVKLNYLDEWNDKRKEIAKQYHEELDAELNEYYNVRLLPYNNDSVYHLFVIEAENRDKLKKFLEDNDIETGIHYPIPIHKQDCYRKFNNISLPIAEDKAKKILSLPIHPYLQTEEVSHVCNKIKEFYSGVCS